MLELSKDDRALRRALEIRREMDAAYAYIVGLPMYVWRRLVGIVGGGYTSYDLMHTSPGAFAT